MEQGAIGSRTGMVIAVCTSLDEGLPKWPQPEARIAQFGFAGDFHCKPNIDRHITIVGQEALTYANEKLGLSLTSGELAENITTGGLGDLSDVPPGAVVKIKGVASFEVVGQNEPCGNLKRYHKRLAKVIYGKHGLLCRVIGNIGGSIRTGDRITIEW